MYSIHRGGGESWLGKPGEYNEKSAQYSAYLKSLNIPKEVRIISASSREEANKIATAWFNQEMAKVDNNIVNSFAPLKVYLAYTLLTLPETGDTFVPFGELKEFGDLSLKK